MQAFRVRPPRRLRPIERLRIGAPKSTVSTIFLTLRSAIAYVATAMDQRARAERRFLEAFACRSWSDNTERELLEHIMDATSCGNSAET